MHEKQAICGVGVTRARTGRHRPRGGYPMARAVYDARVRSAGHCADSSGLGTEVNHHASRGSGVSGNAAARPRKYFRCRRQSGRTWQHLARSDSDPNVWSGRALPEVFSDLAECGGLASMYPASDWSGLSSGPSWISARLRSHYRTQTSNGPFGSPGFASARKTGPPSRLILSQTSAGKRGPCHHASGELNRRSSYA